MAEKGKKKHRIGKWIAWLVLVIIPCWIFIGGIDCEPPDDADLLLPQSDEPYTEEGNGWIILSNVLSRAEKIGDSWMYENAWSARRKSWSPRSIQRTGRTAGPPTRRT